MIGLSSQIRAFVCAEPVDMRNAVDGLSAGVQLTMRESPASGHLFLFVSRARNRVKILYYERNGFVSGTNGSSADVSPRSISCARKASICRSC